MDHFFFVFLKKFVFASLCSFICLQAVYQLSGPEYKSTWSGCPSYSASYLHFIFVIDFLSRKVIIFSVIATDDCHPLRSRSIRQNAANCMTICFRYIAQPGGGYGGGVRKTYCERVHIMMFDPLPVGRTACRVRRQWSR